MAQSETSLADRIMAETNVPELRQLCKDAGVKRDRGASKADTATKLVKEAPAAAYEFLGEEPPKPGYDVICTCGLEENYDDPNDAVEIAEEHKNECKAWTGVTGLGGLNVWSAQWGDRIWLADEGWASEKLRD